VVCMNEEQSARRVARFGLEVPLTPRRQLLALHDPRSAMTLEKALLTAAKARTIVVLFMIVIPKSNSESDSMQNSQMELDLFELNDFRKEETVAAPLTERTPKLMCSLDLTTSKQSMFGSYPRSGHTVLAYSTENELVLRIKSIEIQLWPLIKLSSVVCASSRLSTARQRLYNSQGTTQEEPKCYLAKAQLGNYLRCQIKEACLPLCKDRLASPFCCFLQPIGDKATLSLVTALEGLSGQHFVTLPALI
jgi:hypothetical protein